ncbi:hypothetical protein GCM10012289_09850 [Nonomuraea cavernae]|uniref:Uncharacterized protein n=1 Tax=Nonomuraea cavernae TaxID=2045107 RepID=A0A917YPS0_9ACTN|nr:hypothetical protein GCM10012289_09850 [Nonomuraea cavernae]
MTPTVAMSQLRVALAARGVSTRDEDVRELRGGCYSILNLQGLSVTCGPEWIRWFPVPGSRWGWHRATDPAGAAHALAALMLRGDSGSTTLRTVRQLGHAPRYVANNDTRPRF